LKINWDHQQLSNLRKLLEVNYGSPVVTSTDCSKLGVLIAKNTYGIVSSQTLRRFFGLVNTDFNPSHATLNILAKYCGYEDWAHFGKISISLETLHEDIIDVCIAFFQIEIPPVRKYQLNEPYFYAVQNIAKLIYRDVNLYSHLIPKLAQISTAHEYFFERFPYIDKFGSGLAEGYKFYLKNKTTSEATIFGNGLLFLGAFLQENFLLAEVYLKAINKIKEWKSARLHPFVLARLLGSNLAYNHVSNDMKKKEEWLIILENQLNDNPNQFGHNAESCEFEFMICEYLLLCEDYDLIKSILRSVVKKLKHEPLENKANFYYIPCHIIYYKSLIMTNDYKAASKVPFVKESVNWQIADYYTLHILQCKLKTITRKVERKELLKQYFHLLNMTRFTYFNKLME
jgi:hypothetical protein